MVCFCLRKSNEDALKERRRVSGLFNMMEPSLLQFYVSRQWLNKFKTFAEPGPISNDDFLCLHGGAHDHVVFSLKPPQGQTAPFSPLSPVSKRLVEKIALCASHNAAYVPAVGL